MSTYQFHPIAIVVKCDSQRMVEETVRDIEEMLKDIYGDGYGIAIYDPGDEVPTIAVYNDHDKAEEAEGE